jgi:hypothetical protein
MSPTLTKAGSSRRSLVLALITYLAQFMVIVDSTIVQWIVALPSLSENSVYLLMDCNG